MAQALTLVAEVPLPDWLARSDIVRFDLSRRFASLSTSSKRCPSRLLPFSMRSTHTRYKSVSLAPTDLERELGGPVVRGRYRVTQSKSAINFLSALSVSAGEQMAATQPLPRCVMRPYSRTPLYCASRLCSSHRAQYGQLLKGGVVSTDR
jgi:hypothetical protein